MDMVTWLEVVSHSKDGFLVLLLFMLFFGMVIDTLLGAITKLVANEFSSFKLKIGIIIKLCQLALTIFILIPLGIFIGNIDGFLAIGTGGVYTLMIAFILGELYSILGHLKVVDDKSNWLGIVEAFVKRIFNTDKK